MKLPILKGADNVTLRTVSSPVKLFDAKLRKLLKDMTETMYKSEVPGIGLAAPQIGQNVRAVVVDYELDEKRSRTLHLINPEIIEKSEACVSGEEGCLSLPEAFGKVLRPASVKVRFQTETGAVQILAMHGINARCIQHEIDHLDGVLFIDRVEGKV